MKDRIKVTVATVPNGYTLDLAVEGQIQSYMYFNLTELLEGFMYHVGLQEFLPYGKAEIKLFLDAASKWQDNEMLVKELLQKEEEIKQLKEHETLLEGQLAQKREQNERLKQRKRVLEEKLAGNTQKKKPTRTSRHRQPVEKPRAFDPRGRVVLTPSGEITLTLRVEIKMTPEKQTFFRGFL